MMDGRETVLPNGGGGATMGSVTMMDGRETVLPSGGGGATLGV